MNYAVNKELFEPHDNLTSTKLNEQMSFIQHNWKY